jgi:hypothetical protein
MLVAMFQSTQWPEGYSVRLPFPMRSIVLHKVGGGSQIVAQPNQKNLEAA